MRWWVGGGEMMCFYCFMVCKFILQYKWEMIYIIVFRLSFSFKLLFYFHLVFLFLFLFPFLFLFLFLSLSYLMTQSLSFRVRTVNFGLWQFISNLQTNCNWIFLPLQHNLISKVSAKTEMQHFFFTYLPENKLLFDSTLRPNHWAWNYWSLIVKHGVILIWAALKLFLYFCQLC